MSYIRFDEIDPREVEDFENYIINGIHASRYVVSWLNACGAPYFHCRRSTFRKWLESLVINGRHLTEAEVIHICRFGETGKLELQSNAANFIKEHNLTKDESDLRRIRHSEIEHYFGRKKGA